MMNDNTVTEPKIKLYCTAKVIRTGEYVKIKNVKEAFGNTYLVCETSTGVHTYTDDELIDFCL